jgi:large subunit ribosomal protein L10
MTKERKQEVVRELTDMFDGASGLFSIDFTGLDVANTNDLRQKFSEAGVSYRVAKNTLVKRVLSEMDGYEEVIDKLVGQSGIAIGYDDPAAPARVLKQFLDDNKLETPTLKFAVVEGVVYESDDLKTVAAMPSREDIMASIVGSLHAPISDLVNIVNAVMRDLASVIEEVAKKQAEGGEASE